MTHGFQFYLGSHHPNWLWRHDQSFFVSDTRLRRQNSWGEARRPWALDPGGFSELNKFGEWRTSHLAYAHRVQRYQAEIGKLRWVAPQDWMCEEGVLKKTGLSVKAHQFRTVMSVVVLRQILGKMVIPVLQGWQAEDYLRHADMYAKFGFDLASEAVVGVGSVCRRQTLTPIHALIRELHARGVKVHAFGFKADGLRVLKAFLSSSDSMAWFDGARWRGNNPLCPGLKKSCSNCLHAALEWKGRLAAEVGNIEGLEGVA